jgi:hypothetical protein
MTTEWKRLTDLAYLFGSGRTGGPVHHDTLLRWCRAGKAGVKLGHRDCVGCIQSTEELVLRFIADVKEAREKEAAFKGRQRESARNQTKSKQGAQKRHDRATEKLKKIGAL